MEWKDLENSYHNMDESHLTWPYWDRRDSVDDFTSCFSFAKYLNEWNSDNSELVEIHAKHPSVDTYRKVSDIRDTKYQNLDDSRLFLQLSMPNPLKPSVKSIMKM